MREIGNSLLGKQFGRGRFRGKGEPRNASPYWERQKEREKKKPIKSEGSQQGVFK